jgi:hypothetical protein
MKFDCSVHSIRRMIMVKVKNRSKGHADHVASADVVSPQSGGTAELTQSPTHESEGQGGQTQPGDDFDMGIRELAYFKWEAAGFPTGDGFDFWVEAEREIRANRTNFNGTAE